MSRKIYRARELIDAFLSANEHLFFPREELVKDFLSLYIIRRLILRYNRTGELNVRNLNNNITILYNIFGISSIKLYLLVLNEKEYEILLPFLKTQINFLHKNH